MKRVYTSHATAAQLLCDLLEAEGIQAVTDGVKLWRSADVTSVWVLEDSDLERPTKFGCR